ncbi:cysteine-rich CWC family protein [Roseateles koreensis]|uniref:Cysteine-rich CWC family protein n=1 Tax=Roseateles koreensis TaxID=2987526 RepID=A0ABT5KPA9_9BURK|nr:cysteine-rich CWC family protein [Roseateles koreensis]MDC8784758.1 cysteine-rich CWC family protein [Roseateles koreensis]
MTNAITPPKLDDVCPRCGGGFHCGARDARCACCDMKLSEALLKQLSQQYERCLCLRCLTELQAVEQRSERSSQPAKRP